MAPGDPFSRGRNGCVATDGQANAERAETLKVGENLFLGDALVGGDQSQDRIQCPDTQKSVGGNRHPLMARIFSLQDHVAADLVHDRVAPMLAQVLSQIIPGEISRQLHRRDDEGLGEGEALVPDQMQPDTAGGRIKGIKEVSSHGLIDRSTHRRPVIPLRHDRLREALGDIAAIRLLRHLKDQLLHGVTHSLLSRLNQPRTSFAMLHHSFASLRLRAS